MGHHRLVRFPSRKRLLRIGDALIPIGVGLFLVLIMLDEYDSTRREVVLLLGVPVSVLQAAALTRRRTHPEAVTAIAVLGGVVVELLAPETVLPVAAYFAVGSLAAARPPRISITGLVGVLGACAVAYIEMPLGDVLFAMALAVGAWALGEAARNRRVAISGEARRAVADEQARIARELHDVIAHSVSMMVVQAAAADDVFDSRPDQARASLRAIEHAGRDALRELRRLLGAVRPGDDVGRHGAPAGGRPPGRAWREPLRAGGLEVVLRREGPESPLPAGVDLSAYRIVQEALTNTLRHARATRAEVTLRYGADELEVDVRDDGRVGVVEDGRRWPRPGGHA